MATTTANEMAKKAGVNPKSFRAKLRKNCEWHDRYARWTVLIGSIEHNCMKAVLDSLRG